MSTRTLKAFLFAVLILFPGLSRAGCTYASGVDTCDTQASFEAFARSQQPLYNPTCQARTGQNCTGTVFSQLDLVSDPNSEIATFMMSNGSGADIIRGVWPKASSTCTVGAGGQTVFLSNDGLQAAPMPTTGCFSGCAATIAPNGQPSYAPLFNAWRQDGFYTLTGATCPGTTPPPPGIDTNPSNPTTPPVNPLDPFGSGGSGTPPPGSNVPPPQPPTPPPPATPPPDAPATNNDISKVTETLGPKLDGIYKALVSVVETIDQASNKAAATQQGTTDAVNAANSNIVGAIHGIPGSSTTNNIDLTATNNLLTAGNTNTASIKTNTDAIKTTSDAPLNPTEDTTPVPDGVQADKEQSATTFDQSGFGWSRSCPANPTFDVFGQTFTIDMSPICTVGSLIGLLLVMMTFLACARIATGSS